MMVNSSRTTKTKRLQYSQESMLKAMEDVKPDFPIAIAAKSNKVPRITLYAKVKGNTPLNKKFGPKIILTTNEETLLVIWLFHVADCEFPVTKSQLSDSVQVLLKNLARDTKFRTKVF